ncbi:orotate phosphoribosyltransferase PyrE [Gottschalkia purinilytica]|uniref:Orotate phosphoribosyltransferase n=1 Tax=Gottschalkia purinilytica TaxID=1503 RepID=A0A0L0W6S5_GOTPU|nr:orotate phosphoribosyltransferase [Gottschalkia purinilytica]KNF07192.1 orotate phosphoribosyltransferase PyrE [Gottschalkia purinilytica]
MKIETLKEKEILLEGHFILSSGKHSDKYIQCAKLLQYPDKAEEFLKIVVNKVKTLDFDIIVGSAIGGIIVAYEIGRQLGKPVIFTERKNGKMTLRRGFEIKEGQKILIADDVVATGKTSKEIIELFESLMAKVIGVACIVDKEGIDIGYPIYSCRKLNLKSFEEKDCPLCKKDLPIREGK